MKFLNSQANAAAVQQTSSQRGALPAFARRSAVWAATAASVLGTVVPFAGSIGTNAMVAAGALAAVSVAPAAFAQEAKPTRIRGTIASISGSSMKVHRNSGDDVEIMLPADVKVGAVKNVKLTDIKQGSFIGTAATTGVDGKLTAREVVVFPESARGQGEGHYAWDLGSNSTMTNGNVDAELKSTDGRHLTVSYKGGTSQITVPDNVPVVTFAPASRADLLVGKKVFLAATKGTDGMYSAARVVVEKDGVAPPM